MPELDHRGPCLGGDEIRLRAMESDTGMFAFQTNH